MKKICILFFIIVLFSCQNKNDNELHSVNLPAKSIQSEMFLSDQQTLNVFYDLAILDTCVVFADFFSDSLIQIRPKGNSSCILRNLYRGNGPNEFVTPYFNKSVRMQETKILPLIDVNSGNLGRISLDNGLINVETEKLPSNFPFCSSLNETDEFIYGVDIEQNNRGLFFIWNKKTNHLQKRISYYPEVEENYKDASLPFLYLCDICVNEKAETVVAAMLNMNIVHFYDLKGEIKRTCMIGNKLLLPKAGGEYLDFPDSDKYFTNISGSEKHVYCLYNGTTEKNGSTEVFIFTWAGELVKRLQLDKPTHRIIVDDSEDYLLGIVENEEGGSNVVKYTIN